MVRLQAGLFNLCFTRSVLTGFGKFSVKEKAARKIRHPATGEDITLDARKVVTFKYSRKLKAMMNKGVNKAEG
ncbi:MAG: HU family DNA-binding protein [Deltaproteobacteria bacterium]|nr:HU family DNA-binding protein [Deltaproteobacteria bacterium]